MKEHKAETPSALLKWWPELAKLFEHANIIGIRLVCRKDDTTAAFQFGDVGPTRFGSFTQMQYERWLKAGGPNSDSLPGRPE